MRRYINLNREIYFGPLFKVRAFRKSDKYKMSYFWFIIRVTVGHSWDFWQSHNFWKLAGLQTSGAEEMKNNSLKNL